MTCCCFGRVDRAADAVRLPSSVAADREFVMIFIVDLTEVPLGFG